ncbi:hypothetical protein PtA15_16A413 [Puccinia triticina]|uniref:GDP/GTP exchange factor Sec2 N-terminal domain-containing protein n=1 Tax=Puccinia triticina TaxID=208348 RepID=A0ABY7D6K2_9BASI|nr:uncharacterized protein PtA15_16A413 [Puccinia triticina]WAQ92505.1 hypothetical protein PtA15_16A413 [Puccinia triticina]
MMVVFRTRKSSTGLNESHDSSGDPSPPPSVPNARVLSPIQAHGLKQYSFRSDFNPPTAHPLLRPSSSCSNQPYRSQTPQLHPPRCPTSFTPRYSVGCQFQDPLGLQPASSIQASPHQPQQQQLSSRSRLVSFMGAQDQSVPNSNASSAAPGQSSFRLFKSKIFSSTSKFKPSAQPGLTPSSATGAPYLSPSLAASSDHVNNPTQASHHELNTPNNLAAQQKFNTLSHVNRPNGTSPSQPKDEPVDWVHLDPSGLPGTPRQSNDYARPTSIIAGYSTAPGNRILIDPNSSRRNYPQFNNKPPIQAGPRVMRLNPQSENLKRLNTPPSGNAPTNDLSFYAQSLRPTPVPHGGSGTLLSINPSHSIRPVATNQPPQHVNPPPPALAYLEPISTSLAVENTHPSTHPEPPILNRLGSNEADFMNAPQVLSSIQSEQPSKASSSPYVGPTFSSTIAPTLPQSFTPSAEPDSLSSSLTNGDRPVPEPSHEDGYHPSVFKSSLAYRQQAAPTDTFGFKSVAAASSTVVTDVTKPVIESQVADLPLKLLASPPAGTLDLGDFSYLFANPNGLAKRTDTIDCKLIDSSPAKPKASVRSIPPPLALVPSTEPSRIAFPAAKSPSSTHETLSTQESRPSSTSLLSAQSDTCTSPLPSLGSDQRSPTRPSTRSLMSPSPHPSTPVKSEKLGSPTSPLHITNPSSPRSPLPVPPSAGSPFRSTINSSFPTVEPTLKYEKSLSPLPSSSQRPNLPDSRSQTPDPPSNNTQSQLELEQARQMILGLQNQVQQLKEASIKPSPKPSPVAQENISDLSLTVIPPADITSRSNKANARNSVAASSVPTNPAPGLTENLKAEENRELVDDSLKITTSETNVKQQSASLVTVSGRNPQQTSSPQHAFPSQCETPTDSPPNDSVRQAERSVPSVVPSRLPIAQHRLRGMASTDFEKTSNSNMETAAPIPRRQTKPSLTSSVSTEYRYDTPESYSTQVTTPSPISTTHRSNRVPSGKQTSLSERMRADTGSSSHGHSGKQTPLSERMRVDTGMSSQGQGWARERQNSFHNAYPEKASKLSRLAGQGGGQEPRWLPARPLNDSSTLAALSRSSSALSQSRVRPDPANSRPHRQRQASSSISLSIHDEESSESGSELDSLFERTSHSLSNQASRSGLDSVNEESALNMASGKFNKFSLRLMTKPELLTIIKKQRVKLEHTREAFAAERDDLLDTLEQTREKEAELSRERERLLAEDAWKTEELNRAREEIGWLSRLADTLELEKSRLETRANSMANELKRAVVDLRTVSTASSQGLGSSRDVRPQPGPSYQNHAPLRSPGAEEYSVRKSDSGSQGRSMRKSSFSHTSLSNPPHRVRQESVESNSTICRLVTSPQLHASKSQNNLRNLASSSRSRGSQGIESAISPRTREFAISQRKSPAQRSVPDFRSPLSPMKTSSHRYIRHERLSSRQINSRRPSGSRSISSGQSHTDDQDEEQANSEDELREDVIMEEEPDERSSRDVYWVQRESDRRHSRSSSASSQAISPSSTVFADHHRGHSSRTAARSNGSEDQHSNGHRSSLISLQLRPEDELFLENYLEEDGDGIDTDIDY